MEFHPAFYSSDADEALIGNHVRPDLIGQKERDSDPTEGLLLEINRPDNQGAEFIPANEINSYNSKRKNQSNNNINNEINEINTSIDLDLNQNGEVEGFNENSNTYNSVKGTYINIAIIIVLLFLFFILMSD